MNQAVNHAAIGVKLWNKVIKKPAILKLVFSKRCISHKIGQLNQPRSFGIHEEWDFCKVSEISPFCAVYAKVTGKRLERPFVF